MAEGDTEEKKDIVRVNINGREVDVNSLSVQETLDMVQATDAGLSQGEAKTRLETYGPNRLPHKKRNPVLQYLGYIWNPLSWAMEAAAIVAIVLQDYADFALILALLFLNATISYVEESSADKAIQALTAALAPKARVLRDGEIQTIEAADLVPGDIVMVRLGDIVPADIKVTGTEDEHDQPLQVDQAALTGESLPVKKGPGDIAFGGSTIKQGERHAVVYATGPNTFFGRSAALISGVQNVPNIQKIMTRIGACCLITIFVWIIIELAVQFGHYRHHCDIGQERCPTLLNVLVIVVGGIPIAMPTVLSVTLALGSYRLASEGAIVARMSAVEEMAGTDILCSDKTGTLTLNQLTINNEAINPLEGHTLDEGALEENYKQIKFVPFNPVDKYTVAIVKDKNTGATFRIMKGAPQVVLRLAANRGRIEAGVKEKINEFAGRGFRALGLAVSEGASGLPRWEMIAVLPMYDPPRHDTKQTIEHCLDKGIQVKMVTGDQLLIGKETAKQLGMGTNMYTTDELLQGDKQEAETFVEEADGFAEVFPEHKYAIVEMLQNRHHTVAMTGDGVNDAPALKKADVGIAVAGATDAARGAADIVLTEPGLSTIVTAVIGARKIFQRMTTYAKYTVAMTFRICFTFGILTTVYNWYFPTLLVVLMAVFNDGAMIALSKDRVTPSRTPNRWNLPIIFGEGIFYGLYLTFSTWLLYFIATKTHFFADSIKMYSLNDLSHTLDSFCLDKIAAAGLDPLASACTAGKQYETAITAAFHDCASVNVLDQCRGEQYYVRNSMTRSLIYNYVSISGQALVFVMASTLIAIFGFGGYPWPSSRVDGCRFCMLSTGGSPPFFEHKAPVAHTESGSTDSTIGCTYYVIVAWIWAMLFYLGLDPLKWALMWIFNEEGFRDRRRLSRDRRRAPPSEVGREEAMATMTGQSHVVPPTYQNALGRASISPATEAQMQRASVVLVDEHGRPLPRPAAMDNVSSPRQSPVGSAVQRLRRVSMEMASKAP
ncbi:g4068 [Coccomyxa elongata]